MFSYSKIRLLSKLKKSILKQLRNSLKSLLFLIILLKITLLNEKKRNFKSLKNKENIKDDLDFRIANKENEKIKRFNMNIN